MSAPTTRELKGTEEALSWLEDRLGASARSLKALDQVCGLLDGADRTAQDNALTLIERVLHGEISRLEALAELAGRAKHDQVFSVEDW